MADYATLLRDHVTLTCRSEHRIFLQAYVPKPIGGRGVPVPVQAEGVRDPLAVVSLSCSSEDILRSNPAFHRYCRLSCAA